MRALETEPPAPPPGSRANPEREDPEAAETDPEPAPGRASEPTAPETARTPETGAEAPASARFAPELRDDDVERWLAGVEDTAAQALRAAAEDDAEPRRSRPGVPAW